MIFFGILRKNRSIQNLFKTSLYFLWFVYMRSSLSGSLCTCLSCRRRSDQAVHVGVGGCHAEDPGLHVLGERQGVARRRRHGHVADGGRRGRAGAGQWS